MISKTTITLSCHREGTSSHETKINFEIDATEMDLSELLSEVESFIRAIGYVPPSGGNLDYVKLGE